MNEESLKGGKADNMSISDIAKAHGVNSKAIEKEIEIGMGVESEHTNSKEKQREIAKDHVVEDEKYYTDPENGLIAMEKKKEKLNEEAKKMMSLAGIKEGDKKFLKSLNEAAPVQINENKKDDEFIVLEFEQEDVEPGPDDDQLYKLH